MVVFYDCRNLLGWGICNSHQKMTISKPDIAVSVKLKNNFV